MPQPSVVPPLLNSSATAANRFFERRSSRTTRTCGSPNTPRTLAAARKPGSEYPSDSRRRRCFDLAILQHAKIERIPNLKKALIHKLICRYNPLKSSTRLPEDPGMKAVMNTHRKCEHRYRYVGSATQPEIQEPDDPALTAAVPQRATEVCEPRRREPWNDGQPVTAPRQ